MPFPDQKVRPWYTTASVEHDGRRHVCERGVVGWWVVRMGPDGQVEEVASADRHLDDACLAAFVQDRRWRTSGEVIPSA